MIRKAERDRRHAINRYNQEARRYNAAVRQQKREIAAYNRKAKAHNARVRQDRQRLINELKRLERQASTTQSVPVQASVRVLNEAYQRVDLASESWSGSGVALADLAETETANSAAAANALFGDEADLPREETVITDELRVISAELDKRWQGALFSLDSRNPDAARHFCTSSREILTRVIDLEAPDDAVLAALPDCETLDDGRPIRRAKIGYLLSKSGADHESLRDFVETDVHDVMKLFRVFNDATHGDAGVLDLNALRALKQRVEGAIKFLSAIVRPAT
ncbi:MAG TPA: hypothetical protein VF712_08665 [Thermoleophilaceae bacterium]|jgi:hypothetical protein